MIVGTKRTSLKHELVDMLVILKINREFMIICHEQDVLRQVELDGILENIEEVLELTVEEEDEASDVE